MRIHNSTSNTILRAYRSATLNNWSSEHITNLISLARAGDHRWLLLLMLKKKFEKNKSRESLLEYVEILDEFNIKTPALEIIDRNPSISNSHVALKLKSENIPPRQLVNELLKIQGPTEYLNRLNEHYPNALEGAILRKKAEALVQLGRIKDALDILALCATNGVHDISLILFRVNLAINSADWSQALTGLQDALSLNPCDADCYSIIGNVHLETGSINKALYAYRTSLSLEPSHERATNGVALSLFEQGNAAEALRILNAYTKAYPQQTTTKYNLAYICNHVGRGKQALRIYSDIEKSTGISQQLMVQRCATLVNCGMKKELHSEIERSPWDINHSPQILYEYAKTVAPLPMPIYNKARQFNSLDHKKSAYVHFALYRHHHAINDYDGAWYHLHSGNEKMWNLPGRTNHNFLESCKISYHKYFSQYEAIAPLNPQGSAPKLIFIIGLPRTGSTLVENILSSHSQVVPGGESPALSYAITSATAKQFKEPHRFLNAVRAEYLKQMTFFHTSAPIITDKMPFNFFYLPIIQKAFPDAQLVFTRRNFAHTAFSMYEQCFSSNKLTFTFNLLECLNSIETYASIKKHINQNFQGKFFEIQLEELTQTPDVVIERLLDGLSLPPEAKCFFPEMNTRTVPTASSTQVRNKITNYKDTKFTTYFDYFPQKVKKRLRLEYSIDI